jgi:serine/threonine protein kinase
VSLKKLGRYDLVRVLGKGAMGIVYEGRDPNLDRRVAIKTVKVENLSEEAAAEYEARFRNRGALGGAGCSIPTSSVCTTPTATVISPFW